MLDDKFKRNAAVEIKKKIKILNIIVVIVIFLLLLIIASLSNQLKQHLINIPEIYWALTGIIIAGLAGFGFYSSIKLSGEIIHIIGDYSERLSNILDVTRDLREEIYGDILLNNIMTCSLSITKSDTGSIMLLENDNLVFKIVKGVTAQDLVGKTIPKDSGIAGWVFTNNEPLLIRDVSKDKRFNQSIDHATGYQTHSILCVPLRTKLAIIGVIEILNKKEGFYNEQDLEVINYLADQAAISIERARFYDDERNYEIHMTDILLATIDKLIPEKVGHASRVAKYANVIARAMDMPETKRRRLYFASLMHDIGFLKIPSNQHFQRPFYIMHPVVGYEMLYQINFYKDISSIILNHHERYDGSGYPGHLKGGEIPVEARIIAIAESFDCMASKSSYEVAVDFNLAIKELLKNKEKQFDPKLVDLFVENIKAPLS